MVQCALSLLRMGMLCSEAYKRIHGGGASRHGHETKEGGVRMSMGGGGGHVHENGDEQRPSTWALTWALARTPDSQGVGLGA